MKKDQLIAIVVALLVVTSFAGVVFHYESRLNHARNQQVAIRSEAEIYRNKFNESVAERAAFQGSIDAMREEISFWKTQGDTLRSKVSSSTRQITLLKQKLNFTASGKPEIVYTFPRDTVIFSLRDTITYKIDTANRWIEAHVAVNSQKYDLEVQVKELDLELTTETKRRGLFGRKYTTVKAISRNPYVENQDIKTVTIQEKRPVISKAIVAVAGVLAGLLL